MSVRRLILAIQFLTRLPTPQVTEPGKFTRSVPEMKDPTD